jgi:hypothetical protein
VQKKVPDLSALDNNPAFAGGGEGLTPLDATTARPFGGFTKVTDEVEMEFIPSGTVHMEEILHDRHERPASPLSMADMTHLFEQHTEPLMAANRKVAAMEARKQRYAPSATFTALSFCPSI